MNTFSENPMFLFVDDLADDSPNFASEGKIVELFDTGCDARTPGAALKMAKEPDAVIHRSGSTQINIPNVRKPVSLSLRQDKTPITGTFESPKQRKLTTLDSSKDELPTKSKDTEVRSRPKVSPEQQKARPNSNRTWLSSKYGDNNRTMRYKTPAVRSTTYNKFEERAKTSLTKSATNPRTTSKVTSEASLNHRIEKFVNRAVDKDSLSNCSRQLEIAKTSGALASSKTSYVSRLPKSDGAAKFLTKSKPNSGTSKMIPIGKEMDKPEGQTNELKIIGDTGHVLQDNTTKIASPSGPGQSRGVPTPKSSLNAQQVSQRRSKNDVKAKVSTTSRDFHNRDPTILSTSSSKITASKVPQLRNGRNSLTNEKNVQRTGNLHEIRKVDRVSDAKESKSNERLSSKIHKIDTARCRELESKVLTTERTATYSKNVSVPSAKQHDLTPPKAERKNSAISFQRTKLSKPRSPSIVPKLMNEFSLHEQNQTEVSTCSTRSPTVPSIAPKPDKTESTEKPAGSSEMLSDQLNARVSKFSHRVKEVSGSKIRLSSGVIDCRGIDHQNVGRSKQTTSKVDVESVRLSRVKGVAEQVKEIQLKSVCDDTSTTVSRKPPSELSTSFLGRSKTCKEPKLRPSPVCSSTESKVPRPVAVKRIPWNPPAKTRPKKQEPITPRRVLMNPVKGDVKKESNPLTPAAIRKSVEHVTDTNDIREPLVVARKEEDEEVIAIMNPALYNVNSIASHHYKRTNLKNSVPQESVHGEKLASWIDGHEQAYLKGRAIGLKVASMARAAKEGFKSEFIRSGLRSNTPISASNKSQEIVEIGVSLIEKVLAEKDHGIHSLSVPRDEAVNYHVFDKTSNWNSRQRLT